MTNPCIVSIGTANPDFYLTQSDAYRFYDTYGLMPAGQRDLYARLFLDGPIEGRHIGIGKPEDILNESVDGQIARFTAQGRAILARACRNALELAGIAPSDLGGIVVNTCTGYICPGMTSYLAEDLALRNDIKAIDIMGMGCGAAIPNLECGCGLLTRTRGRPVISASVEICSATHLIDDDPGLTVSNAIFGDGAAAVVLQANPLSTGGLELLDFETGIFPEHREALRYRHENGRLRNTLTRRVPLIGAQCIETVCERILARNGMRTDDVAWWAVHAGGTEVLRQVAKKMRIPLSALDASVKVFEKYGNMSSPTVLFALKEMQAQKLTRGPGLILAFGAGFTAFAALAKGA